LGAGYEVSTGTVATGSLSQSKDIFAALRDPVATAPVPTSSTWTHLVRTQLKTEAIAGITTFFTMAYIVIVNPQILSADGKTGMAFTGVLTATVSSAL